MASDSDDDCDILGDLLANDDDFKPEPSTSQPPRNLKELDYNFLDNFDDKNDKKNNEKSLLDTHGIDSSDDEDNKYFNEQKYSESGKSINDLLKNKNPDKLDDSFRDKKFSNSSTPVNKNYMDNFEEPKKQPVCDNNKVKKAGPLVDWLDKPSDVYCDPCFGLRIIKPLISSTELKNRMKDRTAVTVSKIKQFIVNKNTENDWVIAGVLIQQSASKKSQNGKQYCIWSISDLSENINTVSVFLFSSAYKTFWKTQTGTVIGILNPNILESRSDKDQATLSIDNPQKIMILGNSRDMGICKSTKKNGDKCTNIINKNKCEYCIYHVKQEYNKASRRSELQTDKSNRKFGNTFGNGLAKNSNSNFNGSGGMYNQQHNHQNILAIPAKKNIKMENKDNERLAMLTGSKSLQDKPVVKNFVDKKTSNIDQINQTKKDTDRLSKIRDWTLDSSVKKKAIVSSLSPLPSTSSIKPKKLTINNTGPMLGAGATGNVIDFSSPITKKHITSAKLNAIKWAKEKGGIKESNPNKICQSREKIIETSMKKRNRENDDTDDNENIKKNKLDTKTDRFKEIMNAKSSHSDLIEMSHNDEKEKYFNKLETKEKMEEKMMTTFKIDTKAVKCLVCKYTSFSASDLCKEKRHPLRVIDAVKSFFKCGDCGNRTVSLDRLPSTSCKKCSGSNWRRTGMMDEKRNNIISTPLSIRGGEEKFIGSTTHDANINLLVPDTDK
ncbi:protein MCM10 homolog [Aphidius gifuensis]|uniref:protein MCM10 homolog n=1 Tax=Aphidius gifuensis TaxID=684658 RepID=UPI001CDCDF74|nr:protein MCM10 homolog [Aphidius gifuensis]